MSFERETPEFFVIVGAARSGTTLVRLLLDAHSEIASPAEVGIPGLIEHYLRVWWPLRSLGPDGKERPFDEQDWLTPLPAAGRDALREAVLAPMRYCCQREGKRIFCDKSLDTAFHLPKVRSAFPSVRTIAVYRHVMDVVASAIEASPWGFSGYGFTPFIQASPDNFVLALVNYWLHHVNGALAWEDQHPAEVIRVRYEDLVAMPAQALAAVFSFMNVEPEEAVVDVAFERAATTRVPGDYKIVHTRRVHERSVGRGRHVPVDLIPAEVLEHVNHALTRLGYEELTAAWNAGGPSREGATAPPEASAALARLMSSVRLPEAGGLGPFAVVADDDIESRWIVDARNRSVSRGDGDAHFALVGSTEALVSMLSETENLGVLLVQGRVRHLTPNGGIEHDEMIHTCEAAAALLRTRAPVQA